MTPSAASGGSTRRPCRGILTSRGSALHDTIEDTETTEQELRTTFGEEITHIVVEMTGEKSLPKEECKRWQIEHAQAALVKLADRSAIYLT